MGRYLFAGKNEVVCFFSEKDIRQTTGWTVLHPLSPENFDIDTISRHGKKDKKGAGNNADFEGQMEGEQH